MSKISEPQTLLDLINEFVVSEFGIRDLLIKKIQAIGIDPAKNFASYPRGMYSTTFLLPSKKIVIKLFDKEPEEPMVAKLPNNSRYALQAFCFTNIVGNRLGIFPMLNICTTEGHIDQLRDGLATEGYNFDDRKLDNVGITECGTPYVIDEDAILVTGDTKPCQKRSVQWEIIAPNFEIDHEFNPMGSGWNFDPAVLKMMTTPHPLTTHPRATSTQNSLNHGKSL